MTKYSKGYKTTGSYLLDLDLQNLLLSVLQITNSIHYIVTKRYSMSVVLKLLLNLGQVQQFQDEIIKGFSLFPQTFSPIPLQNSNSQEFITDYCSVHEDLYRQKAYAFLNPYILDQVCKINNMLYTIFLIPHGYFLTEKNMCILVRVASEYLSSACNNI